MNNSFRWAVGFEGSFIPHLGIDEYLWTGHDEQWKRDFELAARDLGCSWLRYPIAWHRTELSAGSFDWRWCDERIGYAHELGLGLIVDLAHAGTPAWLPNALGDLDFPQALERWARAFSHRYRDVVHHICPFHEPATSALLGGALSVWPPFGRGERDYCMVASLVAQGTSRAISAIREEHPGAEVMITHAAHAFQQALPSEGSEKSGIERGEAAQATLKRHLSLDLLLGRVDAQHPLRSWLLQQGASRFDLDWFERNPAHVDVLGLTCPPRSCPSNEPHDEFFAQARSYWATYGLPMMLSEASSATSSERAPRMEQVAPPMRRLREGGVPVLGYVCRPMLDHVAWDSDLPRGNAHVHPVGLYRLQREPGGWLRRCPTALSEAYAALISRGDAGLGEVFKPQSPSHEASTDSLFALSNLVFSSDSSLPAPRLEAWPGKASLTKDKDMSHTSPANGHQQNGLSNGISSSSLNSTKQTQALGFPIVVHCHLQWDWVWQRPQQFLSRLSTRHRILFCEGPTLVQEEVEPSYSLREAPGYPNVTIMNTQFPASRFHDGEWVDEQRTRLLLEAMAGPLKGRFDSPVQWFYDPMAVPSFIGKVGESANVYDCMDQLSQFRFAPPALIERERMLLEKADVVFAGGRKMWEDKKQHNSNAHFYGCGVDVDHFATALDEATEIPADIDASRRPILGYFGVVDERLDYELIEKLARHNPEWSVCIVGPVCKVDPNALPQAQNLFWLGGRDYSQLPAYTKAFDVCLMPFAMNEATEFINPTKALEYMATARPIVSTPVPDVVSNFGEVVKIAASAEEFIAFCEAELAQRDEEAVQRGVKQAHANSWDSIVAALEGHIEDALQARAKAAAPKLAIKRASLTTPEHTLAGVQASSGSKSSSVAVAGV